MCFVVNTKFLELHKFKPSSSSEYVFLSSGPCKTRYEPTFNGATDGAYQLIKDPFIAPDKKLRLQAEARECEDQWDDLNDKMKLHVDR